MVLCNCVVSCRQWHLGLISVQLHRWLKKQTKKLTKKNACFYFLLLLSRNLLVGYILLLLLLLLSLLVLFVIINDVIPEIVHDLGYVVFIVR